MNRALPPGEPSESGGQPEAAGPQLPGSRLIFGAQGFPSARDYRPAAVWQQVPALRLRYRPQLVLLVGRGWFTGLFRRLTNAWCGFTHL